ncbi:MAG: aminoglycoside phosphotransferase family protein [Chloroflexi bacterium]|nr:aminoglycoside phosphotransferase family protein [Chloroflexota bacterium]
MGGDHALLKAVAAAHARQARVWSASGVTIRRVTGGANNALYRVEAGSEHFAFKLCVDDERQRARREYGALRVLAAAGMDLAPGPLWLDERCRVVPYPVVAYRWLSGTPIGPDPAAQQLAALIESLQRIHSVRPEDPTGLELADAWFHWFEFGTYLDELRGLLAEHGPWLADVDKRGRELRARLNGLVESCARGVASSDADPSRGQVPRRLCRVDPGLANALWCDDGRLRWVDWEYSGWGDPALELADLRWHVSLDGLGPAEHDRLRDRYRRPADDLGFERRLAVWDRLISTRWALVLLRWLWSAHAGPDRERLTQPTAEVSAVRERLLRFIERAERAALEAH